MSAGARRGRRRKAAESAEQLRRIFRSTNPPVTGIYSKACAFGLPAAPTQAVELAETN